MKLSLAEISAIIDQEIGRLSTLVTTDKVIKNRFSTAHYQGRMRHVKAQKRRTMKSWTKLLTASGVLVSRPAAAPESV